MQKRDIHIILLSFIIVLSIGVITNFSDDFGITGKGVLTPTTPGHIDAVPYSPTDNSILYIKDVTFKWNVYGDKIQEEYKLIVDDNLAFNSPENYYGLGDKKERTIIFRNDGRYFWRVRSRNSDGWGEWSKIREFTLSSSRVMCDDGTKAYTCSKTKPLYCNVLKLINDCKQCGCPNNGFCQADGSCILAEVTEVNCVDGTKAGECSLTKPLYCNEDGYLTETSSICGCLDGTYPDDDGIKCKIKVEAPNLVKRFSLLGFINRFFGN